MKEIKLPSKRSLSHFKQSLCLCTWQNRNLTYVIHLYVVYPLIPIMSLLRSVFKAWVMNSVRRMFPDSSGLLFLVNMLLPVFCDGEQGYVACNHREIFMVPLTIPLG